MEAGDSRSRSELEGEIAEVERQIEGLSEDQANLTRDQQRLNQEQQVQADRQSLLRAEIQGRQTALEPQKQSQFSTIAAEEAKLNNELQRIQRDAGRPDHLQELTDYQRIESEDQARAALDDLAEKRVQVEDEMAKQAADLHGQMAELEIEATRINTDANEKNREIQERLNELTPIKENRQRRLESLRSQLTTLVAEDAARAEKSDAEKMAAERANEVEEQLATISQDRERLAREVKELGPLVEAQREATSGQGAEDLSRFYADSANRHRTSWRRWLAILIVTLVASVAGGLFVVDAVAPGEKPDAHELFHSIAVAILVIGILLYAVRIASLQFRVHRNLEAVDRSKAAALRTYNRMIAGASAPEVRTTLVASLADAVFRTGDTGFLDQSSDNITLIERVVGSGAQRLTAGA